MSSKYGNPAQPIHYRNYKEPLTKVENGFGYYGVICETDNGEWVQCHECGKLVKSLAHHASAHNMTSLEYRDKFKIGRTSSVTATKSRELKQEAYKKRDPKLIMKATKAMEKYREDVASGKRKYVNGRKGIPLDVRNKKGTCPDQLLDKLRVIAATEGRHPSYRFMAKKHGGLLRSILTTFGSFREAVVMAGLQEKYDYDTRRYSREELIRYLQIFYKEYGRTVMVSDFATGQLPDYKTYYREFGGISQARAAAHIPNIIRQQNGVFKEVTV
jgi:hypothetical protein